MSGGSYSYLYIQDPDQILQNVHNLEAMATRLAQLGYADDASAETEELLRIVRQFEIRYQVISRRLSSVWRAVEWWDSGDSGEDSLKEELRQYRNED